MTLIFDNLLKQKKLPEWLVQQIRNIKNDAIKMFPNLVAPSGESEFVEDEANKWFQKVFSGEKTTADLIDCMRQYKNSAIQQHTEIYACMIHNLLDEYKFFNKYPEKELKIMGQLFGLIIQNKLMEGLLERISLKYVFEALKRNGKMLRFGVFALEQFIDRLKEWPNSIETLIKLPNLKANSPELYQKVLNIYQAAKPATISSIPVSLGQQMILDKLSPIVPALESPINFPGRPASTDPKLHPPENMSSPPQVFPVQSTTPLPWGQERQGIAMTNILPPKRDPNLFPSGPSSIANYQALMKKLGDKQLVSEYQGHPQNLPAPHLPTLLQGTSPEVKETRPEEEKLPNQKIVDNLTRAFNLMNEQEMKNSIELTKSAIEEDMNTLPWLANVIVKRASSEPNHHQLFLKLLNSVDNKNLLGNVLSNTYYLIKTTLEANKENQNPSDGVKKTMRNLGAFLGIITIAENRPILAKDLDIKEVIMDAYSNGAVTLAILLICPLLRQIINSKVFKPKNPWVHAIFCLLLELRGTHLITSNLSLHYEINNLFEFLQLSAESLTATNILQAKPATQPSIIKVIIIIFTNVASS